MEATTMLRCGASRVIDALTLGRSWQKRRELRVNISRRNSNRLPRKALRVIGLLGDWDKGSQETERQRDGQREERCNDAE
jgi:hypothetical protein